MKTVRYFGAVLGFALAIGASFAFRPEPNVTGWKFISGTHPSCSSLSVPCGAGSNTCVISGVTYREKDDAQNGCGAALKMP